MFNQFKELKNQFDQLDDTQKLWYDVLASYLINHGGSEKTAHLSSSQFTRQLEENNLLSRPQNTAKRNNNPAERFLKKLEELKLITKQVPRGGKKRGRPGNIYTLNFYIYRGEPLVGCVPLSHPLYLKRNIDFRCEEFLMNGMLTGKNAAFLKIKSPRYMGKTSLLIRLKSYAEDQKKAVVGFIDLNNCKFPDHLFVNPKSQESEYNKSQFLTQFLDVFKTCVKEEFQKHIQANSGVRSSQRYALWANIAGGAGFTNDLEDIFASIEKPKLLIIDGIDRLLGTLIQNDFLLILRSWFEDKMKIRERGVPVNWPNLIIAFSTESYFNRESPLQNVGTDIKLDLFTEEHILHLAHLYGLMWDDGLESASKLKEFLGGNPYLINIFIYEMIRKKVDLDTQKKQSLFPDSPFIQHLRQIVNTIQQDQDLEKIFVSWIQDSSLFLDEDSKIKLGKLGAIIFDENSGKPQVTCQLYKLYFEKHFLK